MLMYEGLLDNYKDWTMETKTIMHYWLQRQYLDRDGQYRGNFKLLVQLGDNKLILSKSYNNYTVKMSETKNPMVNFDLLKSACELVQINMEELKSKMQRGRFLILTDMIQPIMDPNGVDIVIDDIADIHIDVGGIHVREEKDETKCMVLDDTDGHQIMKTPLGLMVTDYIPFDNEFEEFFLNGISIYSLSKIRIFSSEFDFADVNPDVLVEILDDLDVKRPKISDITKERLAGLISNDWEVKGMVDYFDDTDDKYTDENIMGLLMNTELTADDIKELIELPERDVYDDFMDPNTNWDLINNLPTVRAKFQPQKILDRVLFCKYHFIARSCMDPRSLSKSSIKAIYKQTGNLNIVYSLVYLYDRLYTMSSNPSPSMIDVSIRSKFSAKFKLNDEEFNLL